MKVKQGSEIGPKFSGMAEWSDGEASIFSLKADLFRYIRPSVEIHNEKGPAIVCGNGNKMYYLNGIKLPYNIWEMEIEKLK